MDIFLKAAAGVLMVATLGLTLSKTSKDTAILLAIAAVAMVLTAGIAFLEPVFGLLDKLLTIGNLSSTLMSTLIKAVGIALLSEIVSMICADAGSTSLGKALQILATAVMLWLSVPLFMELLELIEGMLQTI